MTVDTLSIPTDAVIRRAPVPIMSIRPASTDELDAIGDTEASG
ncbi:MAG: hypothetical protein V5A46_10640 [Haloferacaceae archaeon]